MRRIIFLVGLQGSGKTTLLDLLKIYSDQTVLLKPSTTRPKRNAGEDEYHFEDEWDEENFAWTIVRGEHKYGMRKAEIEAIKDGLTGVTVFAPEAIDHLNAFRERASFEVVTVGVDTIESTKAQFDRVNGDSLRMANEESFHQQLNVVRDCDIVLSGAPKQLLDAFNKTVELLSGRGGVLTKSSINALINAGALLRESNAQNIESASYDLRISDTYWCQGKYRKLREDTDQVVIPPYSFILAQAKEEACLPRFVSGSFDLSVSMFFDGVVLSNGPQVDPGYRGSLFCMLYNSSDVEVALNRGQKFATIQFFTTVEVAEGYSGQYQNKKTFQDFLNRRASRSAGGKIFERIAKVKEESDTAISNHKKSVWAIIIAVSGVFVAMFFSAQSDLQSGIEKLNELELSLKEKLENVRVYDVEDRFLPSPVGTINIVFPDAELSASGKDKIDVKEETHAEEESAEGVKASAPKNNGS